MPVHEVSPGRWRWGRTGKTYPTKAQAEAQALAIHARGWQEDKAAAQKHLSVSKRAETRYVLDLVKVMRAIHDATLHAVHKDLADLGKGKPDPTFRHDDVLSGARQRLRALWDHIQPWVKRHVGESFDRMALELQASSARGAKAIGLPSPPKLPGIKTAVDEARAANVALITKASKGFLEQVRQTLEDYEGVHPGTGSDEPRGEGDEEGGPRDLAEALQTRVGVSRSRAVLIARDQVGKLAGRLNAVRQQAAGIGRFKWSTARDERVRGSHREVDGKTFSWDDDQREEEMADYDISDDDPSEAAPIPGQPVNCRCIAVPIVEEFEETPEGDEPDEDQAAE